MDSQSDCFVTGAFAIVLHLARFAGVAPLGFAKNDTGWRVQLSKGWSIYGYIIVTVFILMITGSLMGDLFSDRTKSMYMQTNSLRLVSLMTAIVVMMGAGTAVYGAPGKMKAMIACLNQVMKINSKLDIQQWPTCREGMKISLIFIGAIAILILSCVDYILLMIINPLDDNHSKP